MLKPKLALALLGVLIRSVSFLEPSSLEKSRCQTPRSAPWAKRREPSGLCAAGPHYLTRRAALFFFYLSSSILPVSKMCEPVVAVGEDFSNSRLLNVVTLFVAYLGEP